MAQQRPREGRIDLIRGASLLLIFAAHCNFSFSFHVQQSRGFADASELFVMMAGMSAALAYRPARGGGLDALPLRRVFARVFRLYWVHLLLVGALLFAVWLPSPADPSRFLIDDPDVLAFWQVESFGAFWSHAGDILLLRYMPADLDILPLYIVLLSALPFMILVEGVSAALLLAGSFGLWLAAGFEHVNLPNLAQWNREWFFDPLSWQVVFVLGYLFGARMKRGNDPFPFRRPAFAVALAFALVAVPANLLLQFTATGTALMVEHHTFAAALVSKSFCGFLRLLNALALVYVLWNLDGVRRASRSAWAAPVADIGRHSLPVFATGLVLSMAVQGLTESGLSISLPLELALLVFGCMLQLRIGVWRERRRLAPQRDAATAVPGSMAAAR